MRIHKRLIDIVNPNNKTIDSLQRIELPAGVDIEIKIQARSSSGNRRFPLELEVAWAERAGRSTPRTKSSLPSVALPVYRGCSLPHCRP